MPPVSADGYHSPELFTPSALLRRVGQKYCGTGVARANAKRSQSEIVPLPLRSLALLPSHSDSFSRNGRIW